jgi:hypothetical protein
MMHDGFAVRDPERAAGEADRGSVQNDPDRGQKPNGSQFHSFTFAFAIRS